MTNTTVKLNQADTELVGKIMGRMASLTAAILFLNVVRGAAILIIIIGFVNLAMHQPTPALWGIAGGTYMLATFLKRRAQRAFKRATLRLQLMTARLRRG